MDKEVVEHMHETMRSAEGLADWVNYPHIEEERKSQHQWKYTEIAGLQKGTRLTYVMFSTSRVEVGWPRKHGYGF